MRRGPTGRMIPAPRHSPRSVEPPPVADTLILCRSDIAGLVSLDDCIGAVEEAWRGQSRRGGTPSGVLGTHVPSGGFHVKTAVLDRGRRYFAAKLNANFLENQARHGLPTIQGVVALFDGKDGRLLALLDSMEITRLRTGASTAIAAKHLSRPDASRVALFGCGTQGHVQLEALSRVRPLRRVVVHDRDRTAADRLVRALGPALGVDITATGEEIFAEVRTSDIVSRARRRAPPSSASSTWARGRSSPRSGPTARTSRSSTSVSWPRAMSSSTSSSSALPSVSCTTCSMPAR
jgi:ornithine cyclodeaminase/alanine dehydrogenase-like protein (mu-crystallin family)